MHDQYKVQYCNEIVIDDKFDFLNEKKEQKKRIEKNQPEKKKNYSVLKNIKSKPKKEKKRKEKI